MNSENYVSCMELHFMSNDQRRQFNAEDIVEFFHSLGSTLDKPVTGLLIGGGAMSLKGDKIATKDVDLVVRSNGEFKDFLKCARAAGFEEITDVSQEYHELNTTVLVNPEEFHIDLFLKNVCNRLVIHDGIMKRAQDFRSFGLLDIFLMADEDLFLSKSVTERPRDLDDMYELYKTGLDETIIMEEMKVQDGLSDTIWEAFLTMKLDELEERFTITIPWKKDVEERAVSLMENNR